MMWKPYQKHYTNSYFFVLLVYCERWQPYSQPPPTLPPPQYDSLACCVCGLSLVSHMSCECGCGVGGEMFACLFLSLSVSLLRSLVSYIHILSPRRHRHPHMELCPTCCTPQALTDTIWVCDNDVKDEFLAFYSYMYTYTYELYVLCKYVTVWILNSIYARFEVADRKEINSQFSLSLH